MYIIFIHIYIILNTFFFKLNLFISIGTKVRGGLTLREALTLCEIVHATGRLTGLDLVEVNPVLAKSQEELDKTVEAALEVILAALGKP